MKKNNELKIQLENSFDKIKQLECDEKDTNILSLKERNDLNRISFNESDKIKKLEIALEKEKESNKVLLKEKNDLNEQLVNAKSLILSLTDEPLAFNEANNCRIMDLENSLSMKDERINQLTGIYNEQNNQISKLRNSINLKEEEIKQLHSRINTDNTNIISNNNNGINSITPGENVIGIGFMSVDQKIQNYISVFKDAEIFVRVEEKLYEEYPEFKEHETFFLLKGAKIKRFKTLRENNIKNGDIIIVHIYMQ